jgi:GntR family transcriptional regulator / MocR family aminotransferase
MRRVFEERRRTLLNSLEAELSDWLRPWPSSAGLHLACAPRRRISSEAVAQSAAGFGVTVQSLGEHGLALGYGAIEASQIEEGIRRLRMAIAD